MKKIKTEGRTVEEIRKATTKESTTQIDAFDMFYDQITLDDAIKTQEVSK